MRFLFSCNELGLGHASRVILLGRRLEKRGHELYFLSGGKAYELLEEEFEKVHSCTPVAWYENARGVITSASLLNILMPLPYFDYEKKELKIKTPSATETIYRYYDLRKHIRRIKPDLVISDGDIHALRLAHRWKVPSVYVTNIIRPSCGFSPLLTPGERFVERYVKKCVKIIVPDNSEPYTICEHNLGDLEKMRIKDKVEFVGSFVDLTPVKGFEEHIFAPISGPLGTRAQLAQMVIPVLEKLETKIIISLGEPGEKIAKKVGNCEIYRWLSQEERQEFMRNAKLVVFSGGHTTCFETIKYTKPSVCVPTQPEQKGNSRKMQDLKCSITVRNKKGLRLALQEIEGRIKFFKSNVEILNSLSDKSRSLDRAVDIIEDSSKT